MTVTHATKRPFRVRRPLLVGSGVVVVLAVVLSAWPAYRWWTEHHRQAYKARCRSHSQAGEWDKLQSVSERWLEWDPRNGTAWLYRAEAAQEQNRLEAAVRFLDRIPDDHPKCIAALLIRMELLFDELNRPVDAAETCRRILEIDPLRSRPRWRLISYYAMSLQRRKLVRLIRESIDLQREPPEAYVYLVLADTLEFSDRYNTVSRWLQQRPDYEPFLVARAYHIAHIGPATDPTLRRFLGFDDANPMDRYLERFPQNLEVLAYHLEQRDEAGDVEGMGELLDRLPPEAEHDSRFWRFKGRYHLARNELEQAEAALREAIRVHPYDWQSRQQLVNVLRRQNRPGEAEETARLALNGKELARRLTEVQNPREISSGLLQQILEHARACGDAHVTRGLRNRLTRSGLSRLPQ